MVEESEEFDLSVDKLPYLEKDFEEGGTENILNESLMEDKKSYEGGSIRLPSLVSDSSPLSSSSAFLSTIPRIDDDDEKLR